MSTKKKNVNVIYKVHRTDLFRLKNLNKIIKDLNERKATTPTKSL